MTPLSEAVINGAINGASIAIVITIVAIYGYGVSLHDIPAERLSMYQEMAQTFSLAMTTLLRIILLAAGIILTLVIIGLAFGNVAELIMELIT